LPFFFILGTLFPLLAIAGVDLEQIAGAVGTALYTSMLLKTDITWFIAQITQMIGVEMPGGPHCIP
jgi:hypothetical protein